MVSTVSDINTCHAGVVVLSFKCCLLTPTVLLYRVMMTLPTGLCICGIEVMVITYKYVCDDYSHIYISFYSSDMTKMSQSDARNVVMAQGLLKVKEITTIMLFNVSVPKACITL